MRPWLLTLMLATMLVVPTVAAGDGAELHHVAVRESPGGVGLELGMTYPAEAEIFVLSRPHRVVIDLRDTRPGAELRLPVTRTGGIRGVRHGLRPDGRLRIVLDLDGPVSYSGERFVIWAPGAELQLQATAGASRLVLLDRQSGESAAQTHPAGVAPAGRPAAPAVSTQTADAPRPSLRSREMGEEIGDEMDGAAEPSAGAQAAQTGGVFVFGAPDAPGPPGPPGPDKQALADEEGDASAWTLRVDRAQLETGVLGRSGRPADTSVQGRAVVSASRALGERWEMRLGARVDGHHQRGGRVSGNHVERLDAAVDETWLRLRGDQWRMTAGLQTVIWGRVDEIMPTDRLSTKDFTRFGLDEVAERRRAAPALRFEWFHDEWTLDALWLPVFQPAAMPDRDSIWHPVDRARGRILGLPPDPALGALVRSGGFRDRTSGDGGGGLRLSRAGRGLDYAVTVQRARHSQPYYRLDETARRTLLQTGDPALAMAATDGKVFSARHPRTWVVGADLGLAAGAWTWRFEAAWLSDVPVTRRDLSFDTVRGFDWVVGAETFPGDRDLRLTVQLAGMHLLGASGVLDRREMYFVNGEIENPLLQNRMRARLRFSFGLDRRDVYLNPEIAWIEWEPHEFYLGLHWLDGRERTLGGFYADRSLVVLGWRGRF
mgnify:CR=1 FL=1